MILSDTKILQLIELKEIVIEPFKRSALGSNSYDVHISRHLAVYNCEILDAKKDHPITRFEIPEEGYVLTPGKLYLGSTLEYTETHTTVPILEGKSSTGRLGIDIHATAGVGDVGFSNHWTLELSVSMPVRIYPEMPIGQLIYHTVLGEVENSYINKKNPKYIQKTPKPMQSMMFKNDF